MTWSLARTGGRSARTTTRWLRRAPLAKSLHHPMSDADRAGLEFTRHANAQASSDQRCSQPKIRLRDARITATDEARRLALDVRLAQLLEVGPIACAITQCEADDDSGGIRHRVRCARRAKPAQGALTEPRSIGLLWICKRVRPAPIGLAPTLPGVDLRANGAARLSTAHTARQHGCGPMPRRAHPCVARRYPFSGIDKANRVD